MKLQLTWPMVALFAVCVAGVIAAHATAPLSAPAVVSLTGTVTGFVFAVVKKDNREEKTSEPKDPGKQEPPKEDE